MTMEIDNKAQAGGSSGVQGGGVERSEQLAGALRAICGYDAVFAVPRSGSVYGNSGGLVVYPQTEEQIVRIVQLAHTQAYTLNIIGAGTKRGFGGALERADVVLSLSRYAGVIEYNQADLYVTAKAGTIFSSMQELVRAGGLRVALDPYLSDLATVGGVIASNDSGPWRHGYGSARDAVLGMKILTPDGMILSTGGKVVKNVAGYDMKKLYIGAMGTLGIILEVTLRLRPIKAHNVSLLISYEEGAGAKTDIPPSALQRLQELTCRILDTTLEPTTLELVNDEQMGELTEGAWNQHTLIVSYSDVETSVRYQLEETRKLAGRGARTQLLVGEAFEGFWDAWYTESVPSATQGDCKPLMQPITCKIGTKNMHIARMIALCAELEEQHDVTVRAHGGLGHGLMNVYLSGATDNVVALIQTLRAKVLAETGGYCILRHAPANVRALVNPWGAPRSAYYIMQTIKNKLDPQHILNRDRYLFLYGGE